MRTNQETTAQQDIELLFSVLGEMGATEFEYYLCEGAECLETFDTPEALTEENGCFLCPSCLAYARAAQENARLSILRVR